jgi:hypothetical protein
MFKWLKFGAVTRMILKYRINDEAGYRKDSGLIQTLSILLGMAITGISFAIYYEFIYPGILIHTEDAILSAWVCTFVFIGLAGVQVLRIVRRLPAGEE